MPKGFHAGACLDLGAFDPRIADCGVGEFLERAHAVPTWVVVMEDRQPIFFHEHVGFEERKVVPLNRHGPRQDVWTHADLKRLVDAFHAHDVKVLLGYWTHECAFVDDDHPELLIRDAEGKLWQDKVEMNADFSPLRRMRADPARGIRDGESYATWSVRQFGRLAEDFGFDGLFLGDGAMGFRRHGHDWKDLRHFDYHEDWLAEFRADHAFSRHDGCALERDRAAAEPKARRGPDEPCSSWATSPEQARDVREHHWDHWVAFNVERWTAYYREMAEGVHALGGILAAYNAMNYDPALARLHGVDYRGIAEAGLDILVFQAYDYAWGPLGPFGDLHIARKDLHTNLQTLLRTRAHVGYDTRMQIVVTVETEDEVEGWDAPTSHTLGEAYAYGNASMFDEGAWRRAADGAFIVWGNSVPAAEWRLIANVFDHLAHDPPEPSSALVWRDAEARALASAGAPTKREPEEIYAHLADASILGDGAMPTGVIRERHAPTAPLAAATARARRTRSG